MSTVLDVLEHKGRDVFSIDADRSVYEAIELMMEKDVAALLVTDASSQLAGIISERDYARKVILQDKSPRDIKVKEIMTKDVMFVREETSTDKCMSVMSHKNFHHLPVVDRNVPVGIITAGDLFKYVVREQSMAIDELESFIFDEQGGEG